MCGAARSRAALGRQRRTGTAPQGLAAPTGRVPMEAAKSSCSGVALSKKFFAAILRDRMVNQHRLQKVHASADAGKEEVAGTMEPAAVLPFEMIAAAEAATA